MRRSLLCASMVLLLPLLISAVGLPAASDMSVPASVQWTFSMGPDPSNLTPPLVHNDHIYVARNGVLHCLDSLTGAQQWQFRPAAGNITTGAVAADALVIVGGSDSVVYGLNARTGSTTWKVTCSAPIAPTPMVVNGLLMVGANQMVYAVDPGTGGVRWISQMNAPARYGPVSDEGMIYFVGQDGSVQCLDGNTGRYRWGVATVRGSDIFPPVVASGRVIVASGNRISGVARSGGIAYSAELAVGVGGAPTVVEDKLFVPAVDGSIYLLTARSGAAQRKTPYKVGHPLASSPCVTETLVIAGLADGLIVALDRATGAIRWTYRCRAPDQMPNEGAVFGVYGPLIMADGALLAMTGSGDLYRFSGSAPDASGPVFGDFVPEPSSALPGGGYFDLTCSIVDDGSGVEPGSVSAVIDGAPTQLKFDVTTGKAESRAVRLPDGPHLVKVTARDYRGNQSSAEWSFVMDVHIGATADQPGLPGAIGARPATRGY